MSIRVRSNVGSIASSFIILLIGVWMGRLTAPIPPSSSLLSVAENAGPGKNALLADTDIPDPRFDQGAQHAAAHGLEALESDPRAELAQKLVMWRGDPAKVLKVVVDSMSDREQRIALTSLTNFSEEQLDGVRDMGRFTRRVAEVAVDSLYDRAAFDLEPVGDVQFSRAVDADSAPERAQERFSSDGRIYAVFPMDAYRENEVFVKWYRIDEPEILLFDQYAIRRDAEFSYVWLEQENGWAEGEYAVEFYSADEALKKIASGRYSVVPRVASLDID